MALTPKKIARMVLGSYVLIGVFFTSAYATGLCDKGSLQIYSVKGAVEARRADGTKWITVKADDTYCPGDSIRVMKSGLIEGVFENETHIRLDQGSTITIPLIEKDRSFIAKLLQGAAYLFSRTRKSIRIATPFVNGQVEGTEFYVLVKDDHTLLSIFEGQVIAENRIGSIMLTSGQSAIASEGKAPVLKTVVNPRDAVKWALYYPPIIDFQISDFPDVAGANWPERVRKSLLYYRNGDIINALEILENAKDDVTDPSYYTYRASLLLSVGRENDARKDIKKALSLDIDHSHALALQSVISVVQNRKQDALQLANSAVAADPGSAASRVALSYAQQAYFNHQAALSSLKNAIDLDSENSLAWARLSEMWLSVGDLSKAFSAAEKAASLDPRLARTQTVLGFAYLALIKTADAKRAFEEAIQLDPGAPLPRLGLGLASIRDGNLAQGRSHIEVAAALDPGNSLIRSYLGKAFFEEKRDKHANAQLVIAKKLDPRDPTPWLYDAIRKQTMNRPIEALYDLQRSIDLNSNRAIYRSKLMLDEDLASRSASLAQIYSDLGFRQLALVEGWRSLNTDPSNYSAHRFLADSYSILPRHEIARVSELLQSQLLQPINVTPLQPRLAESNLLIAEGSGPVDAAFNEFNTLFHRNRFTLQASGIIGGNDTLGNELVHSAVWNRISYSIGQFHHETEGYRVNDGQKQDIYNAFFQMAFTHKTGLQAEYRYKETEKGDVELRFNPDDHLTDLRDTNVVESIRIGFRHAFSPGSDLIGSMSYQTEDPKLQDTITGIELGPGMMLDVDLEMTADEKDRSIELQYLFRSESFSLITGAGYFDLDSARIQKDVSTISLPFPPFTETTTRMETTDESSRHTNLYLYSQINYPRNITWTIGGSGDLFEGGFIDSDQFNPKLGLTWNPIQNTTLRFVAFRALKRTLISNQTLEPTQVAGFNQFFDDGEGTEAWTYGVAIDQKFTDNLFVGMEYAKRDLKVPFEDWFSPPPPAPLVYMVKETDWEEELGRAYLYWIPHRWIALTGEYYYEEIDRGSDFIAGIEYAKTHRIPLGIGIYHPTGFSGRLIASFVDQEGMFEPQTHPGAKPGDDQFWTFDVSIGYRLPRRLGIFALEAKNIFNESFSFQDTDPDTPRLQPESLILFKLLLAL